MNNEVAIRRSPLVLIKNLVLIEIVAFAVYFFAAYLGNYKYELYLQLPFITIVPYQILKLLIISGGQLVITVYAFLRWYYEFYIISSSMVSHEWGVFWKRSTNVPLREAMSLTLKTGPIRKLLHCGSIQINNGTTAVITLHDISYPKKHFDQIGFILNDRSFSISAERRRSLSAPELLSEEEHERLEFKSSLRFDHRSGNVNKELEKMTMKTVAAFLNSNGGNLVIGVGDDKKPLGLEYDYQTLGRQSSDGFENHFTQIFNKMIGPNLRHLVQLNFDFIDGREVCVVSVEPSQHPVYLTTDNEEYFYVRTGNVSTPLRLSEVEEYSRSRWPSHRDRSISYTA